MTYNAETTTKPDHADANSSSEAEETRHQPSPEPVLEETGGRPNQEEANSKPDQKHMNPEPEYEIISPTPDLKKVFTFDGGYRNPPKGYWYAPGTSGNPKGRPPGSKNKPKNLTDKTYREIFRSVFHKDVNTAGGRSISTARALTENLADLALRGNLPAIKLAMAGLHALDAADAAQQEREYNYALAYKARPLSNADKALAVPNPDDILIDHKNRTVLFKGPRNEEEMWKKLTKQDYQEERSEEEDAEFERNEIAGEEVSHRRDIKSD